MASGVAKRELTRNAFGAICFAFAIQLVTYELKTAAKIISIHHSLCLGFLATKNATVLYSLCFQCSCPDCSIPMENIRHEMNTSLTLGDPPGFLGSQPIQIGDVLSCYHNIHQVPRAEILLGRHSTVFVVNVMLWPTLIFTAGFCGLVFACLFVQKDDCKWSCSIPNVLVSCGHDRLL